MLRKILLSIGVVIVLVAGIEIFNLSQSRKITDENNIVKNETELSSKYVLDDCINEWEDYSKNVQNEIEETSGDLSDENRHYILKSENEIIKIYYINENGEEVLYRVTDISTKYLGDDDVNELKNGIEVIGAQNLNQLLEDFE